MESFVEQGKSVSRRCTIIGKLYYPYIFETPDTSMAGLQMYYADFYRTAFISHRNKLDWHWQAVNLSPF